MKLTSGSAVPVMSLTDFSDWVSGMMSPVDRSFPPEISDLYYLYTRVRTTVALCVLEFGSGWSTVVFARALAENRDWLSSEPEAGLHSTPFILETVESDADWLEQALGRIPLDLRVNVWASVAEVVPSSDGSLGHAVYEWQLRSVPDLVYVDGPAPSQVKVPSGWRAFSDDSIPVLLNVRMIADQLWPGTEIIYDGRTANARADIEFLGSDYSLFHDPFQDRSTVSKSLAPLGLRSAAYLNWRMRRASELRALQNPR